MTPSDSELLKDLDQRIAGWKARGDHIFNGKIVAEELEHWRSRLSAPPREGQWVPKDTIEVIRTIHATLKRGEDTEDHGIVGNLRCILDHVTSDLPDPSAPSHHSGAVVDDPFVAVRNKRMGELVGQHENDLALEMWLRQQIGYQEAYYLPKLEALFRIIDGLREALRHPSSTGAEDKCPKCGQTDHGQYGEYPCSHCGLPLTWDEPISPPLASAQGWQEDVRLVLEAFDKGIFVRDTDNDVIPGWALSLLPYLGALGRLKEIVTTQEKAP